jgi:hypothetical protein
MNERKARQTSLKGLLKVKTQKRAIESLTSTAPWPHRPYSPYPINRHPVQQFNLFDRSDLRSDPGFYTNRIGAAVTLRGSPTLKIIATAYLFHLWGENLPLEHPPGEGYIVILPLRKNPPIFYV